MNWDQKAEDYAGETGLSREAVLVATRWQRDQLRTDEAVERVARAIARLEPGEEWPDGSIIDDEYRDECYETAFAAIDALLGDT